ncbi:MAG: hypothetical protein JO262_09480 [Solirubrobacterales bacterium]|nr:hypothetical protein [Solirubrobacterales bacterium]
MAARVYPNTKGPYENSNSHDQDSEDICKQLVDLHDEVQAMVDAGLLVALRVRGRPTRYALSEVGEELSGQGVADTHHAAPANGT